MRSLILTALALAITACGGSGDSRELAAGNSAVSAAQVDSALGPADQSSVQDANLAESAQNGIGNETAPPDNSVGAKDGDGR